MPILRTTDFDERINYLRDINSKTYIMPVTFEQRSAEPNSSVSTSQGHEFNCFVEINKHKFHIEMFTSVQTEAKG